MFAVYKVAQTCNSLHINTFFPISLCHCRGLRYKNNPNQCIRYIFLSSPYGWYWAENMTDHSFCFYHKSKGIVTPLQALKSTLDTVQALAPSRWSLLILPLLGLTEKLAYFSLWGFSRVSLACTFSLGSLVTKKHMQWHRSSRSKTVHQKTISKIS